MQKIKVGISSCLMGAAVRYDGGHKRSSLCLDELGAHFDFVPDCPELGAGLGVPRPPVRLVGDPAAPRALGVVDASLDVTDALQGYAAQRLPALGDLCGYVFVRNSPSCGLHRVKVHADAGQPPRERGRGLFAAAFTAAYPDVPVEEEGRLRDPVLRDSFLTRVLVLHGWRQLCASELTRERLEDFHARCALLLQARNGKEENDPLARLLENGAGSDPQALGQCYFDALLRHLQRGATRSGHMAVLRHWQTQLAPRLEPAEREDFAERIACYGRGRAPLALPLAALRRFAVRQAVPALMDQLYLRLAAHECVSNRITA
ncbi:MAG TPA: DUF523 and DUF1722 domain-containing protein [Hyphomicrobiales bacterium]|nr:DUF523 and DUF1722 domain-containing protein [Hyphomicrobiales bacterium]